MFSCSPNACCGCHQQHEGVPKCFSKWSVRLKPPDPSRGGRMRLGDLVGRAHQGTRGDHEPCGTPKESVVIFVLSSPRCLQIPCLLGSPEKAAHGTGDDVRSLFPEQGNRKRKQKCFQEASTVASLPPPLKLHLFAAPNIPHPGPLPTGLCPDASAVLLPCSNSPTWPHPAFTFIGLLLSLCSCPRTPLWPAMC